MVSAHDQQRAAKDEIERAAHAPAYMIQPASLRDLFEAHALEKTCFGPDAWGYFELCWALIMPGQVRLKAVADGLIVGLVVGESRPFEGAGWVSTIGVHPDYRRRGIGEALLTACEAALSARAVKLTVRPSNSAALTLYRKFGYEQVATWRKYYAGGEDGVVMEKRR